jgi:hypothetical protein
MCAIAEYMPPTGDQRRTRVEASGGKSGLCDVTNPSGWTRVDTGAVTEPRSWCRRNPSAALALAVFGIPAAVLLLFLLVQVLAIWSTGW